MSYKYRQYAVFAAMSLAVTIACLMAYPQVRRGQILMAESERLLRQGRLEDSVAVLHQALTENNNLVSRAVLVLEKALAAGQPDTARELILMLADRGSPPDSSTVGRAAGLFEIAGKRGEAVDLLNRFRSAGHLATPESLRLAGLLRDEKRYDSALAIYKDILIITPDSYDARVLFTETLIWAGRSDEASMNAQKLLASKPDSRVARLLLARAKAAGGDIDQAIMQYKFLLGEQP